MTTVIPSQEARQRNNTPQPVAFFDERLRYSIPQTAALLQQSVAKTWVDVREGRLRVIREDGRVFTPGSEIVRRSTLPSPPQPDHAD